MEDSGTLVLSLPTILLIHRIGISHGGLRDFGSELAKNTPLPTELELIMEGSETLVLSLPRIPLPPPPQNWNLSWRARKLWFLAYQE